MSTPRPAAAIVARWGGSVLATVGALGAAGLGGIAFASLLVIKGGSDSAAVAAFFTGTAAYRLASVVASGGCENAVMAAITQVSGTDDGRGHRAAAALEALAAAGTRAWRWSLATSAVGAAVLAVGTMVDAPSTVTATALGILLSPTIGWLRIVGRAAVSAVSPFFGATWEALVTQLLLLACLLLPIPASWFAAVLLVLQALVMSAVAGYLYLDLRRRAVPADLSTEDAAAVRATVHRDANDLLVINVLAGATEQFDMVVVGLVLGPYATNAYNLAKRLVGPLSVLSYGVATHYVPELARVHHREGASAGATALRALQPRLALVAVASAGAIAVVGLVAFAPGMGTLFSTVLLVLLVGQVVNVAVGPAGLFLQTTGDAPTLRRISLGIGAGYVALTVVATVTVGALGAAAAQTIASLVRSGWWLALVQVRGTRAEAA